MKRLVTCLLFLGLVMIGCDGDDSSKECTSKCPSGQICVNGSCQTANAQDQTETDTPTGTPPDQQTGDPQDSTNPQDPPSDEGKQPGGNDNPPDDITPPQQDDGTTPTEPVNPPDDKTPPGDDKPTDDPDKPGQTDSPPSSDGHACGSKTCKLEQLCMNNQCVDRNNKAVEGVTCDPKVFVESCDNNNLVHCECDEETKKCATVVSECDKLTCALMVKDNYGMCAKADEKCNAEGELTMCYDIENGFTSYIEYLDCTLATDGKYYPFRTDIKDVDCIGTCLDKYSCNLGEEKCDANYKDHCDGEIATYCSEGKVFRMNCADYGATCSIKDDGSLCDYGG